MIRLKNWDKENLIIFKISLSNLYNKTKIIQNIKK